MTEGLYLSHRASCDFRDTCGKKPCTCTRGDRDKGNTVHRVAPQECCAVCETPMEIVHYQCPGCGAKMCSRECEVHQTQPSSLDSCAAIRAEGYRAGLLDAEKKLAPVVEWLNTSTFTLNLARGDWDTNPIGVTIRKIENVMAELRRMAGEKS